MFRLIRTIKALAKDSRVPRTIRALLVVASFGWLIPGPLDEIVGALALVALLFIRPGIVSEHWRAAYRAPRLTSADRKRAALAFAPLAALAVIVAALAFAVPTSHASAKRAPHAPLAVGLFDATTPPQYEVYLGVGASVTYAHGRNGYNCPRGGYFTDVSAYTWRGGSLTVQRWNRDHTLTYWRSQDGGRVTFDGITFRNHSRAPVLVAGWCDNPVGLH
jgi:hypothetical protein